ncbi:hypothetical protein QLL95_gp0673 [Cotonvirus japonicus]|uniref:Uncharacterized protein n=1 Tax=Cotonvirus japonicus TaxID=2811091 RepID=A0ABM7NTE6_9VIRU|nr:hypothetical protein QLL95_gp0673 [Cotonvirus japonicus]BCS83450.1 hypothetical protein [Cotonvirus japonicus]
MIIFIENYIMRQTFNRNQRVPGTFRLASDETGYKKVHCIPMDGNSDDIPIIKLIAQVKIPKDSDITLDSDSLKKAEVDNYIVLGLETFDGNWVPDDFFNHYKCYRYNSSPQIYYPYAIIKKKFIGEREIDFYFDKDDAKNQKLNPIYTVPEKSDFIIENISIDENMIKSYLKQEKLLSDQNNKINHVLKKQNASVECIRIISNLSRYAHYKERKTYLKMYNHCETSFAKLNQDLLKHKKQVSYLTETTNHMCEKIKENDKAYQILKTKYKSDYCTH